MQRNILEVVPQLKAVVPDGHALKDMLDAIPEAIADVGNDDPMVHWNKLTGFIEQVTGKIPMNLPVTRLPGGGFQLHPTEEVFRANLTDWQKKLLNVFLNEERF
jgi:hypothetical protein